MSTAGTARTLRAARALIAAPECWTRGSFAVNEHGAPVGTLDPAAKCFCAAGALGRVQGLDPRSMAAITAPARRELSNAVTKLTGGLTDYIADFNDTREHADVLRLYDKAIELAEKGTV